MNKPKPLEISEEQVLYFRSRRGHLIGDGAVDAPAAARAILGAQAQQEGSGLLALCLRAKAKREFASRLEDSCGSWLTGAICRPRPKSALNRRTRDIHKRSGLPSLCSRPDRGQVSCCYNLDSLVEFWHGTSAPHHRTRPLAPRNEPRSQRRLGFP